MTNMVKKRTKKTLLFMLKQINLDFIKIKENLVLRH